MRTFKRPMFRKGGNVDNGIMTGIVDRSMHAENPIVTGNEPFVSNVDMGQPKTQAEYIEELRAGAGDYGGMDPLTSFLLTAGPSVAGATSFADAVNKLQPATQQLIKSADAKAKYGRDIKMAGTKLALADAQKFDDRRFNLALKADDRSYQDFLKDDERDYLAGIKKDDRIYNEGLIKDERKFNLELIQDSRAYDKLQLDDKREYDAKILDESRKYNQMEKEDQRKYEQKLIEEGRAFELDKIIRAEDFQKDMYNLEKEDQKKLPATFYAEKYYDNDSDKGEFRKVFEDSKIKRKIIDKFSSSQYGGFLNGGENDRDAAAMLKNPKDKDVGKVFYDLETGEIKRFRKTTEGYEFEDINIDTFVEEEPPKGSTKEEKDAEIDKRFDFFSPNQKRIIKDIQNKPEDPFPGA